MKILQSSFFRALCAIIIGALLIKYREDTMTWITIAIGILFFLSGIISCTFYFTEKRHSSDVKIFDVDGNEITQKAPPFPIVGLGSIILGAILALMPNSFISGMMYILAAILILGAINQYMALASIKKLAKIGLYYWVMPSVILLIGIIAIVSPTTIATAPLFIIGWCMVLYGIIECVYTFKMMSIQRILNKAAKEREEMNKIEAETKREEETTTSDQDDK